MKKAAIFAGLFVLATASFAEVPPIVYDIESNYQQTQELREQNFVKGAGVPLRYRIKTGGRFQSLVGLGARWDARSSATSTQAIQTTATLVTTTNPHYFQFDLDAVQTGSAVTNWLYSFIVTDNGTDYPVGTGSLNIADSAWVGPSAIITNITTIGLWVHEEVNFTEETNTYTYTDGPYASAPIPIVEAGSLGSRTYPIWPNVVLPTVSNFTFVVFNGTSNLETNGSVFIHYQKP